VHDVELLRLACTAKAKSLLSPQLPHSALLVGRHLIQLAYPPKYLPIRSAYLYGEKSVYAALGRLRSALLFAWFGKAHLLDQKCDFGED
jgi:hypothetical protein